MSKVSDLFEIYSGSNLVLMDLEEDPNGVNFVANSGTGNGISSRVVCPRDIQCFDAGLISVSCNGSILASFVQPEPFITGVNMKVLKPKTSMSDTEKWFYCYCLRENSKYYSYGRKADRYLKDIELPDKIPDWVYDCKLELPQTEVNSEIPELHTEYWKSFKLGDLFEAVDNRICDIVVSESDILPKVGSAETNNGVLDFVIAHGFTDPANTLAVSRNVNTLYTTYQPNRYISTDDIVCYKLRSKNMSPEIGLFLCCILRSNMWRFGAERRYSEKRVMPFEIKLPATSTGEPDWNFMELYMRSLPYSDLIKDI